MSNINELMDLLFPGGRQRALAILLLQPGEAFHLRELARATDSHAGTLGRELGKLAGAGLLKRSAHGNQVRFQADASCPLFADLASMFRKTHGAAGLIREALEPLGRKVRMALVFGSMAKGTASKASDVDLLVVGSVGFPALVRTLHPLQEILGREINPVLYTAEEFRERAQRGEAFIRNATGPAVVFVKGSRDDLEELAEDREPAGTRR